MARRKRLGDILQEKGLLDRDQLRRALEMQRQSGEKLGEALVKLGFISPGDMADALSEHLGIPRVDLHQHYIAKDLAGLIPETIISGQQVLPIELQNETLTVAMVDPLNIMTIDELRRITGYAIKPVIATASEISEAFQRTQDIASTAQQVFEEYRETATAEEEVETEEYLGGAPGVRLAKMILEQAVKQRASDVHLEPREDDLRVRFRIDGILRDVMVVPRRLKNDVNSRIKVMANLDITERRRPQDGRIQLKNDDVEVDMRVATLPTVYGEKIVARVFNKSESVLDVEDFGFGQDSLEKIRRILRRNQGLVLVTGPTGSGKTTTLYGFLKHLNSPGKNIITVEDPVEYLLDGINQVQINPRVGLTFANGLRSVLRQDPDIIMVGEIRDEETAEIAVRSALTGHLVLSTLHTNSAVSTITRLLDMNIAPYMISSTLVGVISQRLVRTICPNCKEKGLLTDPLILNLARSLSMQAPEVVYQGKGCPFCNDTGYRGRAAIGEVLILSKALRTAIDEGAAEGVLEEIALREGMKTLRQNAMDKLILGVTTASEVIRTAYQVEDEEGIW